MRLLVLLLLCLIITSALAKKGRRKHRDRNRWGSVFDDDSETKKERRQRKHKNPGNFFTATIGESDRNSKEEKSLGMGTDEEEEEEEDVPESAEVFDLDKMDNSQGNTEDKTHEFTPVSSLFNSLPTGTPEEAGEQQEALAEKKMVDAAEQEEQEEMKKEEELVNAEEKEAAAALQEKEELAERKSYSIFKPKYEPAKFANLERQPMKNYNRILTKNPCDDVECGPGMECDLDENTTPSCKCATMCYDPDPREKVCSNFNTTYPSECHLHREKCLCQQGSTLCTSTMNKEIHIEYNGACKELPKCRHEQLEDFPRRMREWLFNVMKDFAKRNELDKAYVIMQKEAETMQRTWVNAVLWKFCDLDLDPQDRVIDRHELMTVKIPVTPMESCIVPFLDDCDQDNDHKITLEEWGKCLTLEETDIYDRCISKPRFNSV